MPVGFAVVKGVPQLEMRLRRIENREALKIATLGIREGLKPIKKRAQELAKANFKSETISKMIRSKAKKGIGKVYINKMPDRTVTVEGREVPFEVVANILEFGRLDGSMPPRSYMRRAREEKGKEGLEIAKKVIAGGVNLLNRKRKF